MEPRASPRSHESIAILLAMLAFLPWPFYLVAALELASPLMMTLEAIASPFLAVLVLPQVALAAFVLDRVARAFARLIRASSHRRANFAVALAFLFAVSWLPLFGGGENILGGMRLHNLYVDALIATGRMMPPELAEIAAARDRAHPPPPRRTVIINGAQVLQANPVVIAPGGSFPVAPQARPLTREQVECLKARRPPQECGLSPGR